MRRRSDVAMRRKYELFATAKNFSHLRKIIRFCAGDPTSQCDAHTNCSQMRKILLICEKYFGKTANFGRICKLFFAKRPRFSVFLALQIYLRVLKMRRFREKKFAMRRIFEKFSVLFIYLKFPTKRVSWDGRVV